MDGFTDEQGEIERDFKFPVQSKQYRRKEEENREKMEGKRKKRQDDKARNEKNLTFILSLL